MRAQPAVGEPAAGARYAARFLPLRVLIPGAALLVAGVAMAAALTASGPPALPRDQRWRNDVAYLASELPRLHVGGLLRVPRSAWDAAAARLEREVPRLTDGQVIVGMAQMVAMLHDDETLVIMPRTAFLPAGLIWVGSRLYLTVVPLADRDLLGAQVLGVDGHPIAQVLGRIGSVIDYQDPGLLRDEEASYLNSFPGLLYWLGVTTSPDWASFTVRSMAGVRSIIRLPAVTHVRLASFIGVPTPMYLRDQGQPYWLKVLTRQRAVYLKYNACLDDGGFQRLAAQALAVLRRRPSYRLIVDLRDNGGGDTQPFTSLIDSLDGDPALHRQDRIFGLVNTETDSSATYDANSLGEVPNAVLIGQTPGDPIDEFGDEATFRLPYSKIQVVYTTKIVNDPHRKLATPDVVVTPTIKQVLAGDDPVLAAAMGYGRQQPG